jgi:cholesterol transport system auxiliary component
MNGRPDSRRSFLAIVASLPLLLDGCGGLLPAPPQRQLYRLMPRFSFPAGLPHSRAQLLIPAPLAPAGLDSRRIALSHTPVSLDYYADAEWSDRAPFLVQDALVAGFEKSGALPAVATDRGGLSADFVLDTSVDDFTAHYDSSTGPPVVRVALTAKLIRMPDRKIIAHTAIAREQRAPANTLPEIVHAFDTALGDAVRDVVVWTVSNPALSSRRISAR